MLCHTASKFKPINYRQLDTNWKYDIIYATLVINNHILAHQSMEEELEERTMRAEENGKVMRSRDEAVHVTAVRAEPMSRRLSDCGRMAAAWGIRVEFSDGQVFCVPDLCDHREEAEILLNRLKGADLDAAFLPYVVEDYLGELYGLHFF